MSVIRCPDVLLEERFLSRLRGGAARRSLNTLGVLSRLVNFIAAAAERAYAFKGWDSSNCKDIDEVIGKLTVEELCVQMPISLKRPRFLRKVAWWDRECDRHLVIGVFRHGYGRFDLIRKDPDLKFKQCLEEFCETSRKVDSSGQMDTIGSFHDDTDAFDVGDGDAGDGEDEYTEGCNTDGMPETRFLNKLVALIVCADLPETKPKSDVATHERLKDSNQMQSGGSSENADDKGSKTDRRRSSIVDELSLLSHLYDYLDVDAVRSSLKEPIYSLLLRSFQNKDSNTAEVNISGNSAELHITLNEDDIVRISSSLIMYGAPLILDSSNTKDGTEEQSVMYDWVVFIKNVRIKLKPKYVRYFYETCWLPFCYSISKQNITFLNRRLVPNPLSKPVEHCPESRGFCHLFLLRQRRLRAVHFLLSGRKERIYDLINRLSDNSRCFIGGQWRSPSHDIALLEGCQAFGYMNIDAMRAATAHPFHDFPIEMFPSNEDIERRLVEILVLGTEHLQLKSYYRVLPILESTSSPYNFKQRSSQETIQMRDKHFPHSSESSTALLSDITSSSNAKPHDNKHQPAIVTDTGLEALQNSQMEPVAEGSEFRNGFSRNRSVTHDGVEYESGDVLANALVGEDKNASPRENSFDKRHFIEESDILFGLANDRS